MDEKKVVIISDAVLVMSKITEYKLNGTNYLDWSKIVKLYFFSIAMNDHLTKDPPSQDSKKSWLREDAYLFLQIHNSINS